MRSGQLEKTTLDHFHLQRRVRAILSTDQLLPGDFQPIVEKFVTLFRPLGKGSLTADMTEFSSNLVPLLSRGNGGQNIPMVAPSSLRDALERWVAHQPDSWNIASPGLVSYRTSVDVSGTTYRPSNVARGDSYVLIGTENDWRPAQIRSIFCIKRLRNNGEEVVTLLSVSVFRPLSQPDAVFDMYRTFPLAGGRIYYSEEMPEEVVSQNEVLSHFAYTPNVCEKIRTEHFHALPLTRVCPLSLSHYVQLTLQYAELKREAVLYSFYSPSGLSRQ